MWHCPNGLRLAARGTQQKATASARPPSAPASVSPLSSNAPLSLDQCSPMPPCPLASIGCQKPPGDDDRPARPYSPTSTVELASSLDHLPEPPSLSLDEVRQLNDAFNGIKKATDDFRTFAAIKSDHQRQVYSFAGIRLNNNDGNYLSETAADLR
uniref:Ferritin n=1 Tax=Globodera pallida TaxID=36090 RepID=A0A183C5N4_GLOPA